MRRLRVLVLMHHYLVPPDDVTGQDPATSTRQGLCALKQRLETAAPSGAVPIN